MSELPRFQPFPVDLLPLTAADYVRQAAAAIDCDESMVAAPFLSVLAASVGSGARLLVKNDWQAPAIVWTCVIAKSGSAKSPALKMPVSFLRRVQDRFDLEYQDASEAFKNEALRHEAAVKRWKSGDCLDEAPDEPTPPVHRRILSTDGTLPGLADLMAKDPGGKLFLADELAGWLVGMSKFNSAGDDSNSWNELYDGQSFWHDRKVAKSLRVRYPALSVTGGIQPERVFTCFSRDNFESGLAARVLFFRPPQRERRLSDKSVDPALVDCIADRLTRLAQNHPASGGGIVWEPDLIGLDKQAFSMFRTWHDRQQKELARTEGAYNSALAKLTGTAPRIAFVLHMFSNPDAVEVGREVGIEAMQAGIGIAEWFGNEAARLYQSSELSVDDRLASEVVELLQSFGPLTARDMQQRKRILKDQPASQFEELLISLVTAGVLKRTVDGKTGGRPAVLYSLGSRPESQPNARNSDFRDSEAKEIQFYPNQWQP
jgi:hypothetical protein